MTKKFIENNIDTAKADASEISAKIIYNAIVSQKEEAIDLVLVPLVMRTLDDIQDHMDPEDFIEVLKALNGKDAKKLATRFGYKRFVKEHGGIEEFDVAEWYPMIDEMIDGFFNKEETTE